MITFITLSMGLFFGFIFYAGCMQAWDRMLRGSIAGAYCFLLNTFIPDHCQK